MEKCEIESAIEGILFAAGEPVPAERIADALGIPSADVFAAASELAERYESEGRGIRLLRIEKALQLCSAPEYAELITRTLEKRKPPKLTQTALEVLAIVAYYQPVTRAYIDKVRGVDSSYTVGILIDRGLIEPRGKLDVPGRPTLYGTGERFLRVMDISSLDELPELPELSTDEGQAALRKTIDSMREHEAVQLTLTGFTDDG